ncbi:oxidoreductase [Saccharicrinis sp. FJH2]|uniref:oxidoreductase n=1 Tax=Saccharicrinis sp. FJH65 TaxID=3344659 RepID=UPI0035F2F4E5
MKTKWTTQDIPDQKRKMVIVTGSTSGLGKEAARVLAGKGAKIIMAVRNTEKGNRVAEEIRNQFPAAEVDVMDLDLASLKSVKSFADKFISKYTQLDILINNAGVMMCPFSRTEDGFEIQMGTNHLGHFALTGHLMPLLKKTKGSRIVATSSMGHRMGKLDFSDFNWDKRKYNTNRAYGDSKLANLYFTYELSRKLSGDPDGPLVTVAHPGATSTELARHTPFFRFMNLFFAQKVEKGTLPTLRAATDPDAKPGDYFGPDGFMEMKGYPVKVESNELSRDEEKAGKLWELSEKLTGVSF